MNNKKHTLVFDGNHFFFKCIYSIDSNRKANGKILDSEQDKVTYITKLSIDFAAEIRKFQKIINRVVFTVDSSSWRKDFYPESDYKGNRKSDDNINWDSFATSVKEFTAILASKGVIIHKSPGAEGDDIVYVWSTYLNLIGENCIIVSGDRDLMQLVGYNESTDSYTLFYTNVQKKLGVFNGFMENISKKIMTTTKEDVFDIFNLGSSIKNTSNVNETFNTLINDNDLDVVEIDSDKFLFLKVLMGDKGDNVLSAYRYRTNDKTYGISEKKAEKVYDAYTAKHGVFHASLFFNKSIREDICKLVISELKADKMTFTEIVNNIERNVMLVLLHNESVPKEIRNKIYEDIENTFINQKMDIKNLVHKNVILNGTKYYNASTNYVPKNYDFFREVDADINKMF